MVVNFVISDSANKWLIDSVVSANQNSSYM